MARQWLSPVPRLAEVLISSGKTIAATWDNWLVEVSSLLNRAALVVTEVVSLVGQSAAIGETAINTRNGQALPAGIYRISYVARITQAATTSSSLAVTLHWTAGAAQSVANAAIVGNTTTSVQSGSVLVSIDEGTYIRYSTAYASVGAVLMQYQLDVVIEAVG